MKLRCRRCGCFLSVKQRDVIQRIKVLRLKPVINSDYIFFFKDTRNMNGCSRDVKARETVEKLLLSRNYKMIMSSKGRITTL